MSQQRYEDLESQQQNRADPPPLVRAQFRESIDFYEEPYLAALIPPLISDFSGERHFENLVVQLYVFGFDQRRILKVIEKLGIMEVTEAVQYLVMDGDGFLLHDFIAQNPEDECQMCGQLAGSHLNMIAPSRIDQLQEYDQFVRKSARMSRKLRLSSMQESSQSNQEENKLLEPLILPFQQKQSELEQQSNFGDPNGQIECIICTYLYKYQNMTFLQCKHNCCHACIQSFLTNTIKISKVDKILCPQLNCNAEIKEPQIQQIVDPQIFQQYLKFKKNNEINRNANSR